MLSIARDLPSKSGEVPTVNHKCITKVCFCTLHMAPNGMNAVGSRPVGCEAALVLFRSGVALHGQKRLATDDTPRTHAKVSHPTHSGLVRLLVSENRWRSLEPSDLIEQHAIVRVPLQPSSRSISSRPLFTPPFVRLLRRVAPFFPRFS